MLNDQYPSLNTADKTLKEVDEAAANLDLPPEKLRDIGDEAEGLEICISQPDGTCAACASVGEGRRKDRDPSFAGHTRDNGPLSSGLANTGYLCPSGQFSLTVSPSKEITNISAVLLVCFLLTKTTFFNVLKANRLSQDCHKPECQGTVTLTILSTSLMRMQQLVVENLQRAVRTELETHRFHDRFSFEGTYADPKDCTRYYSCSNSMPYRMSCSQGTVWNDRIKSCTFTMTPSDPCRL